VSSLFVSAHLLAVNRLVSLDPGVTELLQLMQQQDSIVATESSRVIDGKPVVGYYRRIPAEGLLSLQPSLVIANQHLGPASIPALLDKSNVDFMQLTTPTTVPQLKINVKKVGEQINCSECTSKVLAAINKKHKELTDLYSHPPKTAVFILMINDKTIKIAGAGSGGHALMSLMGYSNAVNHQGYRPISLEGLLALNPDVILVTSRQDAKKSIASFQAQWPASSSSKISFVPGEAVLSGVSMSMMDAALTINQQLTTQTTADVRR
jgi:iron complex transport system substrate-binding protein